MELGLRLGDSSPPFKYSEKPRDSSLSHRGLEFSLGFSSINPHLVQDDLTRNRIRNHIDIDNDIDDGDGDNGNDDDDDDDDDNDDDNDNDSPFQLDLLPRTPVFHNFSLPSNETGMAVTDGGGESPRNGVISSSMELEFYKYGGGRGCSRASDEDDQNNMIGSDNSKKKLRLSREQSAFLEESFKEHHTLYPKQKLELARRLNLRPRQVEVWFQNRRARTKLKQTEVDCEYLKKCCETLTQENRKLQKELRDLRALKTTDSLFMHSPATTLTMCPSCERIATANTATVPGTGSKEPMSKASGFPFTRPSRS